MAYAARPVPQNIMNVEFKVFDFLTVKQLFIGVGILMVSGLLFFVLPQGWNIVVVGFIIFFGFIVLFVPFNGDPFLVFLSNYLEAMITDQRRVWHKKGIILKTAAQKALYYRYGAEVPLSKIDSYLKVGAQQNASDNTMDKLEQEFLAKSELLQKEVEIKLNTQQKEYKNMNSRDSNFLHTSSVSSDNFGMVNLSDLNSNKHNQIINSQTSVKRESEIEMKNFIFGYVEDEKENPISGAIITLKKYNSDNSIEVLITNAAGEFKTAYEYPEGEYVLNASKDGKNINEIKIYHNPIDPEPILLTHINANAQQADISESIQGQSDDINTYFQDNMDVFAGDYDPNYFSVENTVNENFENQLNTTAYQVKSFENQFPTSNLISNGGNSQPENVNQATNTNTQSEITKPNDKIIDFLQLPNANINQHLSSELIYLFNTINGCITNKAGLPLNGINIKIFDNTGKLVNSVLSDKFGCFYSISPLPNGNYFIDFVYTVNNNGESLLKCFVSLNGLVIPPKLVILNI